MNKPSHDYCKECNDWNGSIVNCMEICSIPINIIEEWEKYHAIGTPEECRAAVEKQKPHKWERGIENDVRCPFCGTMTTKTNEHKYCSFCGQRLE